MGFRNLYIDRLRGVSILAVLALHGNLGLNFNLPMFPFKNGYYGVVIFFTISGFLITRNTLRRYGELASINFSEFYTMRVARILPPLLLFIGVAFILGLLRIDPFAPQDTTVMLSSAYYALTFQYNSHITLGVPGMNHWSPLWSLSVEEIFYLLFPMVAFLTKRTSVAAAALIVIVLIGPMARAGLEGGAYRIWGCADLLAIGCLSALAVPRIRELRLGPLASGAMRWIGGLTLLCVFVFGRFDLGHIAYVPTIASLGTALYLIGATAAADEGKPSRVTWVLEAFGRASYEIYIFHWMAFLALEQIGVVYAIWLLGLPPIPEEIARSAVFLSVVLAGGLLMSKYFSEPLNARIRQFYAGGGPIHEPSSQLPAGAAVRLFAVKRRQRPPVRHVSH